jgi:hypothetical protein
MIAEELSVRPETITLILGDTDKTPDGGYSAGFLTGAANVRKVAAGSARPGCSATRSFVSIEPRKPLRRLLRLNRNGALDRLFPNRVLDVFPIVFPESIQTTD